MKKTRRLLSFIIIAIMMSLLLSVFTGCAHKNDADMSPMHPSLESTGGVDGGYKDEGFTSNGNTATPDSVASSAMIIKKASATIQTTEYDALMVYLKERILELEGYISSSDIRDNSYYSANSRYATMIIRVPSDRLDALTSTLGDYGAVVYFNESAVDVTLDYVDITSRITVLEAEEIALTNILAKAENVTTMLSVRKQLQDVQSDLAALRARKSALERDVAYSTLTLNISEVRTVEPPAVDEISFGEEIKARFVESIEGIGAVLRSFTVWLIGDSPYILIFLCCAVGLFFLVRYLIRRKRTNNDE